MLQLLIRPQEIVGIQFGRYLPLVRLLHEEFIPLLLCKPDGLLPRLEVDMCALHEVGRRLPAHQWILPTMSLCEYVPVHAPLVRVPVAGLCRCLGRSVDAKSNQLKSLTMDCFAIPDGPCLELVWCPGYNSGCSDLAFLAAIHNTLGNWCKLSRSLLADVLQL